jgi:transposase
MHYVGIDLHKKSITVCVVSQPGAVKARERLACQSPKRIVAWFEQWAPFQAVMEATASYEWLWQLLEPLAERLLLAHPGKLRIIAESTRKSDQYDARVLAEFLALGMIPEAYRPSPRQRAHRRLVRQRVHLNKQVRRVKCKIRHILADYNADRKNLFTVNWHQYLALVAVGEADRFVLSQLAEELAECQDQITLLEKQLRDFARSAPAAEAEARAVLETIPWVGPVTVEVLISELGDARRFGSQKKVCAYAGLVPGRRESGGKARDLGITKEGSALLRWVLVEAAWRLVGRTRRWGSIFEGLARRRGRRRAIVAVARRLLCVMVAMMQSGRGYRAMAG